MKWPELVYHRTKMVPRSNYEELRDTPIVLLADHNYLQQNPLKEFGDLSCTLKSLEKSDLLIEEGLLIERQESIKVASRKVGHKSTIIVFNVEPTLSEMDLFEICNRLKGRMNSQKLKHFALIAPKTDSSIIRKLLEICLNNEDITCTISGLRVVKETINREIEIDCANKSYADVVEGLKKMETGFEGVTVNKVATTGEKVTLKIKARKEHSRALVKEINDKMQLKATDHEVQNKGVLITGLCEDNDVAEVKKKIADALNCEEVDIRIGDIRKRQSNCYAIAFLSTPRANALIALRQLRSGWSTWIFKEKIDPDWCVKCQTFGHLTRACDKEMTKGLRCLRCGEIGHLNRDCKNEIACGSCLTKGHQMNSMACSRYRYLVETKRATRDFL